VLRKRVLVAYRNRIDGELFSRVERALAARGFHVGRLAGAEPPAADPLLVLFSERTFASPLSSDPQFAALLTWLATRSSGVTIAVTGGGFDLRSPSVPREAALLAAQSGIAVDEDHEQASFDDLRHALGGPWRRDRIALGTLCGLSVVLAALLIARLPDEAEAGDSPVAASGVAGVPAAARRALDLVRSGGRRTEEAPDTDETGTIRGVVRFDGPLPRTAPTSGKADPRCPAQIADHGLGVRDGALAGAVVYVSRGAPPANDREHFVDVDQHGCLFQPAVAVAAVGDVLRVSNSDRGPHNVHASWGNAMAFNRGMPASRSAHIRERLSHQGLLQLSCGLHPWMRAHVYVLPHRFADITGADGSFAIDGLRPGTYRLDAVHPRLGVRRAEVTVDAGAESEVSFRFSAGELARGR
jgi:plastocyanin